MRRAALGLLALALGACAGAPPLQPVLAARPSAPTRPKTWALADEPRPPLPAPAERSIEVVEKRLSSGVRVLVAPRHELPLASVSLVFPVPPTEAPPGWVRLMAQTAWRETASTAEQDMRTWLDALGARVHSGNDELHAWITWDGLAVTLPEMLAILGQVVREPTFDEDIVERQRDARRSALAADLRSPGALASDTVVTMMFPTGHPARRTREDIRVSVQNAHSSDMGALFRKLAPGAAIVAAGDVDPAALVERLEKELAGVRARATPPAPLPPLAPTPRRVVLVDQGHVEQAHVAASFLTVGVDHADHAALTIACELLGDRVGAGVRLRYGSSYGMGCGLSWSAAPGTLTIAGSVATPEIEGALAAIRAAVEGLATTPPSASDLEKARGESHIQLGRSLETNERAREELVWRLLGIPREARIAHARAVTPADVTRVAKQWLAPDTMKLAVVGDATALSGAMTKAGFAPDEVR